MPAQTRSITSSGTATTQLSATPIGEVNIAIRAGGGIYVKVEDTNPNYTSAPATTADTWYVDANQQAYFRADPSKVWIFGAGAVYAVFSW